jgi:hypothetical protein
MDNLQEICIEYEVNKYVFSMHMLLGCTKPC